MKILGLVIGVILLGNGTFAHAEDSKNLYNNILESNLNEVLGPYPSAGSLEEKQDIDQVLYFQNNRTNEECNQAASEVKAGLKTFFGGAKGPLSIDEINKVQKTFAIPYLKSGAEITISKMLFKRPRPYITHLEIKPCIELENSKSYPSGHATLARLYARILGEIYPERKVQLINRADEIALNRVLAGVHYPSDVAAGKKLGDALADDYLESYDFQKELQ